VTTNATGFRCRVSLWIRLSGSEFGGNWRRKSVLIKILFNQSFAIIYIRGVCLFGVGDAESVMVIIDNVAFKR